MAPGIGDFCSSKSTQSTAYLLDAFELCGVEASPQLRSYKRIGEYWGRIEKIKEAVAISNNNYSLL